MARRTAAVWDAWRAAVARAAWLRQQEERLKAVARFMQMARAMRGWQDCADEQRHFRGLANQLAQRFTSKQAEPCFALIAVEGTAVQKGCLCLQLHL